MIVETVRFMADTLADATVGINAKLAAIGLDASDSRPADLEAVLNEFDHAAAARRQVTSSQATPFAMVFQPRESELRGWVTAAQMHADDVPVAMIVVERNVDSVLANLAGAYYVRCAMQSLNSIDNMEAARTRNGIHILQHRQFIQIVPFEPIGDAIMTRGLLVSWQVRETDVT